MRRTAVPESPKRGFTLIEVVVSGVILAVVVYGLFACVSQAQGIVRNSILRQRAFQELNRVLASQQFSHINYGDPVLCPTGSADVPLVAPLSPTCILDDNATPGNLGDDVRGEIKVSTLDVTCEDNLHKQAQGILISAGMTWPKPTGGQDKAQLDKIITQNRG